MSPIKMLSDQRGISPAAHQVTASLVSPDDLATLIPNKALEAFVRDEL